MIFESHVEDAALAWLGALGYAVLHGPDIAVGEPAAEASTRPTATRCSIGASVKPSPA